MPHDALGDGAAALLELLLSGGPRSSRFLVLAWAAVLALGIAFWRWHAMLLERFGGWAVLLAAVWACFGIYLIGASMSSVGRSFAERSSKSRRAS